MAEACQVVDALAAMLRCLIQQITGLERQLASRLAAHPDAAIIRSQPGLGVVLGTRLLGEFGDDRDRYQSAKGPKALPAPPRSPGPRGCGRCGGPGGVQSAAGGRLLPVGVRGPDRLTRRAALL